jgi:acetate kinase
MMATRAGDVDAGLVLHLQRQGMTLDEVETMLTREAGLLGVGGAADVRDLLVLEAAGDERAALALALFVRRIVLTVGAYLTVLDGRGALVFGGGIGEHSAEIRRRVAAGLGAWNVVLDPQRNAAGVPGSIAAPSSRAVYVIATDEESLIAGAVARCLQESP